jgi:hypothetical protein
MPIAVDRIYMTVQFWALVSEKVASRKKAIFLVAALSAIALVVLAFTAPRSGYLPWNLHTFLLFGSAIIFFWCFGALLTHYKVEQIRKELGSSAPLDGHAFALIAAWWLVLSMFTLLVPIIMFIGASRF